MLTVIMFGGMGSRYHVRYKVCYIKYSGLKTVSKEFLFLKKTLNYKNPDDRVSKL